MEIPGMNRMGRIVLICGKQSSKAKHSIVDIVTLWKTVDSAPFVPPVCKSTSPPSVRRKLRLWPCVWSMLWTLIHGLKESLKAKSSVGYMFCGQRALHAFLHPPRIEMLSTEWKFAHLSKSLRNKHQVLVLIVCTNVVQVLGDCFWRVSLRKAARPFFQIKNDILWMHFVFHQRWCNASESFWRLINTQLNWAKMPSWNGSRNQWMHTAHMSKVLSPSQAGVSR